MPFKLPMIPGFQTCNKVNNFIYYNKMSFFTNILNLIQFNYKYKEIKMRYPKTPDFDIMSGVHIIRSLHVKNENKCNSAFNSTTDLEEAKKPTWLVFDKQVNKP